MADSFGFGELLHDASKYLDLGQLTNVSLVSTSSLFRGLNNLKYNRFIPDGKTDIYNLRNITMNNRTEHTKIMLRAFKSLENVNVIDKYNRSLLYFCVADTVTNTELVKYLIKLGADVNLTYLTYPLGVAVEQENIETIKLLLKAGADTAFRGHQKILLDISTNPEIVQIFIDHGLIINYKDGRGKTYLQYNEKELMYNRAKLFDQLDSIGGILDTLKSSKLLIDAGAEITDDITRMREEFINKIKNSKINELLEALKLD